MDLLPVFGATPVRRRVVVDRNRVKGGGVTAGIGTRTFHRRCTEVLGTTPAKLLESLRVEQARTLLASTELGSKTVAARCGFGSPRRMARAFERTLGVAPREYAALHRR